LIRAVEKNEFNQAVVQQKQAAFWSHSRWRQDYTVIDYRVAALLRL
jgi:hypothetical protein